MQQVEYEDLGIEESERAGVTKRSRMKLMWVLMGAVLVVLGVVAFKKDGADYFERTRSSVQQRKIVKSKAVRFFRRKDNLLIKNVEISDKQSAAMKLPFHLEKYAISIPAAWQNSLGPLAALEGVWVSKTPTSGFNDFGFEPQASMDNPQDTHKTFRYDETIHFWSGGLIDQDNQTPTWKLLYLQEVFITIQTPNGPLTIVAHQETGYWLWNPQQDWVSRSFVVPRGITVSAGGKAGLDSASGMTIMDVAAHHSSPNFGIDSVPGFTAVTEKFISKFEISADGLSMRYYQDALIRIPQQKSLVHHVDTNELVKQPQTATP